METSYIVRNSVEEEIVICDSLERAKAEILTMVQNGYLAESILLFESNQIPFSLSVQIDAEGGNKS